MNIKIVILQAEEGGYWGEAPALPGCASQGDSVNQWLADMREAVEGWLAVGVSPVAGEPIVELAM